ncbi:MAG: polysaccharide biosynthesis protein [Alphaproteobacteria bacterium]|nr:polysaccharide biosynthesis protein [Alphaproteobacteria bacterium]
MRRLAALLPRAPLAFAHDLAAAAVSFPLALWLRVGTTTLAEAPPEGFALAWAMFVAIAAGAFLALRLPRASWRYASVREFRTILQAVTATVLVFVPALFLATRLEDFPRSQPVINWLVLVALLAGPRYLYRSLVGGGAAAANGAAGARRIPVLLAGVDKGAELFLRATQADPASPYAVVGILSPTRDWLGRRIHGVKVYGLLDDLGAVVEKLSRHDVRPQRVVLADAGAEAAAALLPAAQKLGLTLSRASAPTELRAEGAPGGGIELRPVALEDLLNRPQAVLDRAGMRQFLSGRRVLVTGAGGSIGAELARQIAGYGPDELVLVELSEFALYGIELDLAERAPTLRRRGVIADVRDAARMAALFAEARPEIVFHAAALKHVPIVEANPCEGVLINVAGTRVVADAARAAGARAMVLISTDKAVNPTNVMGAAKRVAELYCQALDAEARQDGGTRFVTVRFGNVLGSTGSVVPLFERQLRRGGPLTVTHPEMRRYFMTVQEAVSLVLEASRLGASETAGPVAQDGAIFVLDMGESVRIMDLAEQMIRLAGLRPHLDVEIRLTGLRPGEKLFEEIFHGAEPPAPSGHPGLLIAAPRYAERAAIAAGIERLAALAAAGNAAGTIAALKALVPEFDHQPNAR